jgi:3-oxoacyl-[acyl-carrier protein] reductase
VGLSAPPPPPPPPPPAAGAAVACVETDERKLGRIVETVEAAGGRALGVQADVSDRPSVEAMAARVAEEVGGIDILVNNAAIYPSRPWTEITEEEWDRVLAVNLKGYYLCARACFAAMAERGRGRIVNLSSVTFFVGFENLLDYVSSKGAVIGFTRALAKEVGPHGITVNAIAPGAFPTDAEKIHPDPAGYNQWVLDRQSLKRRGRPEDIGNLVAFLASDAAAFLTGQTIVLDGGWAMH